MRQRRPKTHWRLDLASDWDNRGGLLETRLSRTKYFLNVFLERPKGSMQNILGVKIKGQKRDLSTGTGKDVTPGHR
jgi:hypothetical protein